MFLHGLFFSAAVAQLAVAVVLPFRTTWTLQA